MNIKYLGTPNVFIVEDFYSEEEVNQIWTELDSLYIDGLIDARRMGVARHEDIPLKKSKGTFLSPEDNPDSIIIKLNGKVRDCWKEFSAHDKYYEKLNSCPYSTLVSYYANGHFYKPHHDSTTFTACTYFFKEPKRFTGGDFLLNQYKVKIQIKNNMMVLFPGPYIHQATMVKMDKNDAGYGRYCISQFFNTEVNKDIGEHLV
jgi:hypothetical protein